MRLIQFFVKRLPVSWRSSLRTNPNLASLYTAWLCKAKLHPSVDGRIAIGNASHQYVEKGDRLYLKCMEHHQNTLADLMESSAAKRTIDCCIIILNEDHDASLLEHTLNGARDCEQAPKRLMVVCENNRLLKQAKKFTEAFVSIDIRTFKAVEQALKRSSKALGRSVFIIQCGDILHKQCFAAFMRANIQGKLAHCDIDKIDSGERYDPAFFPDWNPDLQLSTQYIQRGLLVLKAQDDMLAIAEHDFDIGDYLSKAYLKDSKLQVHHIPFVLLHTQASHHSIKKPIDTTAFFALPVIEPLVSIIIPTYNGVEILRECIDSIIEKTDYSNYQIYIVNNNSDEHETLEYLSDIAKHERVTVLDYPHPFNYSAINNFAVARSNGEILALVNNDIEVISPSWLSKMVRHALREDVGCVGAKLLYSNDLVQHAGVVLGYGGGAGHAHKYLPAHQGGYLQRALATQNYSAVTAACLLIQRKHFEKVKGLNEKDLTVAFNDVDFCLRVTELGLRNVWVAEALLYHHESISRGHEDTLEKQKRFQAEVKYLQTRWSSFIEHDPAYNPNLTLSYENFSIRENLEQISL